MMIIPTAAIASQTFNVHLGGQSCQITVYQRSTGLYLDLQSNGASIIVGCLCRNRVAMVRSGYLGFIGDIAFVDTQGDDDPTYDGLGARYQLCYFTPADLVPAQIV